MRFRIAMKSRRAISSLCCPVEIIDQSFDYLIAERQPGRAELLLLAEAGICPAEATEAPRSLAPRNVMIATLVARAPTTGIETFLLNRHIPDRAAFNGLFVPAEGTLQLMRRAGHVTISGVCRLSWAARPSYGMAGQTVDRALCDAPNAVGSVLHIDAAQIPWAEEALPQEPVYEHLEGD